MSKEIVKRKASPSEFREGIRDGIPISLEIGRAHV